MRIFMTGGTGLIGSALCQLLLDAGYQLTVLSRQPKSGTQAVQFVSDLAAFRTFDGFDAVINLAGEPIFEKRWSESRKKRLFDSRVLLTQQLATKICQSKQPPAVFLSASATGFYGDISSRKNATEQTACGQGFAAQLCHQWEQAAWQAESKTRICLLRTGMVLDSQAGALAKMLPLYRLGLGGKLGSGRQHWAWISLADHIQAVHFLLNNTNCQGAFNLVAPTLTTQAVFNHTLAKQLSRPAFCQSPAFLLKWALGERAHLLLDNQPLIPQALLDAGFIFQDQHLACWLAKQGIC